MNEFPIKEYPFLELIKTENLGLGIKSLQLFNKGDIVFSFKYGEIVSKQSQHSLQIKPKVYIEHPIAGYILHSCNPNCWVLTDDLTFICRTKIQAGDFITMDYEQTEDELFKSFNCHCGSPVCRGKISGRLQG